MTRGFGNGRRQGPRIAAFLHPTGDQFGGFVSIDDRNAEVAAIEIEATRGRLVGKIDAPSQRDGHRATTGVMGHRVDPIECHEAEVVDVGQGDGHDDAVGLDRPVVPTFGTAPLPGEVGPVEDLS